MSSYERFDDPYCYPNSRVLKNLADIREPEPLEIFEVRATTLRASEPLPTGNFDPAHYRSVHRHLFQDVYEWAGEYRTIRIAKGGSMFCFPEHVDDQMELLFASLATGPLTGGGSIEDFITTAASFLADLNAIHPFREGNGRTQLTFLFLLGERAGHSLDMARISPEAMLAAMVESFNGRLEALQIELKRICL